MLNIIVNNDSVDLQSTGGQILKRRKENEKTSFFTIGYVIARRL